VAIKKESARKGKIVAIERFYFLTIYKGKGMEGEKGERKG